MFGIEVLARNNLFLCLDGVLARHNICATVDPCHLEIGAAIPEIGMPDQTHTLGVRLLQRIGLEVVGYGLALQTWLQRSPSELWPAGDVCPIARASKTKKEIETNAASSSLELRPPASNPLHILDARATTSTATERGRPNAALSSRKLSALIAFLASSYHLVKTFE
jgi:hypothetical protein